MIQDCFSDSLFTFLKTLALICFSFLNTLAQICFFSQYSRLLLKSVFSFLNTQYSCSNLLSGVPLRVRLFMGPLSLPCYAPDAVASAITILDAVGDIVGLFSYLLFCSGFAICHDFQRKIAPNWFTFISFFHGQSPMATIISPAGVLLGKLIALLQSFHPAGVLLGYPILIRF